MLGHSWLPQQLLAFQQKLCSLVLCGHLIKTRSGKNNFTFDVIVFAAMDLDEAGRLENHETCGK
jgi:hypothetical protein